METHKYLILQSVYISSNNLSLSECISKYCFFCVKAQVIVYIDFVIHPSENLIEQRTLKDLVNKRYFLKIYL
jgi:hypothetical protein